MFTPVLARDMELSYLKLLERILACSRISPVYRLNGPISRVGTRSKAYGIDQKF